MFLLLSRIPNGLDPLRERFGTHVKNAGTSSVEKTVGEGADVVRTSTIAPGADPRRSPRRTLTRCCRCTARTPTSWASPSVATPALSPRWTGCVLSRSEDGS